jgi:hypothetical protein
MRWWTIAAISSSDLSVFCRSGNATLSKMFIEPNSAPSWKRIPKRLRISKSSLIRRLGTDWPWTLMSPSSGNISPIRCLISTLLPVPDGPSTTVIIPSGMPRFRPFMTTLEPNDL